MPPNGKPSIGAVCAFWYDNDSLGGGNFTFLSLDAHGWDVTPTSSCNQAGGTNQLTDWITGADPASVTLNWTDPTYVCSDGGIKGSGTNPNSLLWSSVLGIKGQTRDFPINWEGPGAPVAGAVPQGSIFKTNGDLDKYDIIGFAAMTILDVVTPNKAQGSTGTCALTFTDAQTVQDLASCIPAGSSYTSIKFQPGKFSCGSLVGTVCTVSPVPKTTETATATVTYTTYGSCGPPPANNSALWIAPGVARARRSPTTTSRTRTASPSFDSAIRCTQPAWISSAERHLPLPMYAPQGGLRQAPCRAA